MPKHKKKKVSSSEFTPKQAVKWYAKKLFGTGGAAQAGKKLKGRKKVVDDATRGKKDEKGRRSGR